MDLLSELAFRSLLIRGKPRYDIFILDYFIIKLIKAVCAMSKAKAITFGIKCKSNLPSNFDSDEAQSSPMKGSPGPG